MASVEYSYGNQTDYFSIIVADNDPVKISVQLKNESMPISIVFIPTLKPETSASALDWHGENGVLNFKFYGWENSLGTTTAQVNTHIGASNTGAPIYIGVMHHKVGSSNHLTMQFVVGNSNGGAK